MSRSNRRTIWTVASVIALVLGLAGSAALLAPREAAESVDYSVMPLRADFGGLGGTVEEERALKSEVFVGRVDAPDGEVDIGIEEPFPLPIYAVDVETSLKGQA